MLHLRSNLPRGALIGSKRTIRRTTDGVRPLILIGNMAFLKSALTLRWAMRLLKRILRRLVTISARCLSI